MRKLGGCIFPQIKRAQDCVHAFYDTLSSPHSDRCGKYKDKPTNVMFDGAPCEFYEYEPNPPDYLKPGDPVEKLEKLAKQSCILKELKEANK